MTDILSTSDAEILKTIAIVSSPILLAVIGWMSRQAWLKILGDIATLTGAGLIADKNSIVMSKDIERLTSAVDALSGEIKALRTVHEDVALLKRDQSTMWRRLDELREMMAKVST